MTRSSSSSRNGPHAKLLKEETKEEIAEELPEVDADVNDHVLKALAQVGILYTDSQKTDLERRLAENMLKCRKKADGPQYPWMCADAGTDSFEENEGV